MEEKYLKIIEGDAGNIIEGSKYQGTTLVKGNAGDQVGAQMYGGYGAKIIVEGDAGKYIGDMMNGGKIIIKGNTDRNTGSYMNGGELIVNGTAGECVGYKSKGGEIYLNGDFESIAKDAGAKTYWDNNLVGAPEYAAEMGKIDKYMEKLGE